MTRVMFQVKFVESHAGVSDATAAFVRFAIAAGAMLPFADWAEKEVLFAGQTQKYRNIHMYISCFGLLMVRFPVSTYRTSREACGVLV